MKRKTCAAFDCAVDECAIKVRVGTKSVDVCGDDCAQKVKNAQASANAERRE